MYTLTDMSFIEDVYVSVNGITLNEPQTNTPWKFNRESIRNNPTVNPEKTNWQVVELYFADRTGTRLASEQRSIEVKQSLSLEYQIVEQLIAGPEKNMLEKTIPVSTQIKDIKTEDGICYVNLSKEFINKKLANVESHTVHYGHIMDGDKTLDQVLVIVMKNPHSYTGEDTVEIDCHGGMLILKKVLDLVLKNGARTAEPGEFTKRAFLNGRIDLSQAEAVMDLINSKNDFALNSSIEQLKGGVSDAIKDIRKDIIYHIAFIESALDDPEHISLDGYDEEITEMLNENINKISKLVNSFDNGRIMKEGIKTVILGKPNAGKSSLLNLMLGEDRAIVTDIEGTTRDTLEENINFNGLSLKIIDTAGIRDTEDLVEQIGVNKAKEIAKEGDLIIYVVDGSRELDDNDREIIKLINDKQAIILVNKSDMDTVINIDELKKDSNRDVILFSAKNGEGMDQLEEEIRNMFYSGNI